MSDDDFMQDSDENYDFEYEEDSQDEQEGDVGQENLYYGGKQLKQEDPAAAIVEFLKVPALEQEKGDWGFKGLKQATKLEYRLKRFDDATKHYEELLTYVKSSAITRNYSEKSINNMLDFIEKNADDEASRRCMESFYSKTLESFQTTNNERLWLKTNIKLARLWLDQKKYGSLTEKLRELHRACQKDGEDDPSKGTSLLEVYALEILMYAETRNNKRLKALYHKALKVRSAIPHPNIMGVIREAGGKMHMSEENWKDAQSDFFESFRNYDEAGSMQRIQVLKYLVLTTMLMGSNINPFESPETKAYQNDPRITAMTQLVDAYQRDDVHLYEKTLQLNQDVVEDPFIAENIEEVSRAMRTKGVLKLVAPYTRFTIAFIAKKLKISNDEAKDIVSILILDKKLNARVDEPRGLVEVERGTDVERIEAVQQWGSALNKLWTTTLSHGDGFRVDDNAQMLGSFGGGAGTPGETPEGLGGMPMAGSAQGDSFRRSGGKKRDRRAFYKGD